MIYTHVIKINKRFINDILSGDKRFEIRKNDRVYQKYDHVKFICVNDNGSAYRDWFIDEIEKDPFAKKMFSKIKELESMEFEITFVISGWGLKKDYVAFGIREIAKGGEES